MNSSSASDACVNVRACRAKFVPHQKSALRLALAGLRCAALAPLALTLLAPLAVFAQSNAAPARVTERVDTSRLTTLSGNTHALARPQYDQGAAPADLPMNRIMMVLKRSADQEAALQDLLTQQQTTSSPNFHKWLTPAQFGQQFGPADSDIQAVTSWLASYGFQSIKVSNGRTIIEFSGTAAQVEAGLHTQIHKYTVNGESHWANSSDPQIPEALAPVVAGIVSLHNFPKKTNSNRSSQMAGMTISPGGKPQITFTDNSHGLAPADFNTIYNIAPSMTGAGITIGVIARTNIIAQDVADFRSLFGLGGSNPTIILNGPDPGDIGGGEEAEAVLDATWSGAVAPGATVDLVVSEATNAVGGEDLSEFYIIDNNLADVMTESFSVCEASFGSQLQGANGAAAYYSFLAEEAAAQGITYMVASGDSGPDGCANPNNVQASGLGASVNLLASTPFTVAVGGTQFNDIASPSTYWNTTNNPNTHGSAKSYIPENVWNESCTVAQCGSSLAGLWSSGGGQSLAFPKPIWQAGVAGIPSTTFRLVPDVSMASANHDGYALCLDTSCHANNTVCQGGGICFSVLSGTSASAQVFGGVMALVDQKVGGRVGIANYALYKLAALQPPTSPANSTCNGSNTTTLPASTCIFNDVTSGNTNLTIVGETGFSAGVGYDKATGLGSVNVSNLVNMWSTAITKSTTTALTLNNGTPVNVAHGTAVPVGIVVAPVAPATGTPTGDVSLVANSSSDKGVDIFTLSAGTVSSSTVFLPGGTYQVKAHYEGDGTFLGSDSSPTTVTIMPESSQISLGVALPTTNGSCLLATQVAYGSSYFLSVAVADLHSSPTPCIPNESGSIPTGGVSLTDTVNSTTTPLDGGNFKLNSFGYFEDQSIQLPAGINTIQATYAGDNSFTGSNSSTVITVTKAVTTISVIASPATASVGQNVTLTATVATTSNATANSLQEPTGTVQFFVNGTAFGSPVAVSGGVNSTTFFAQATAQLSSTMLASGLDKITAQYVGDTNYLGSPLSSSFTVNVGGAGVNVTPGCNSSTISIGAPGQSGTCLITVAAVNGFSGSVTLACGIASGPTNSITGDVPACSLGTPESNFSGSGSTGTFTLTSGSPTGTATLSISTTAASRMFIPNSRPGGPNWLLIAEISAALACMFLLTIASRERRGIVTFAALLFIVMAATTGCGGSSSGGGGGTSGGNPGTTLGAYTFNVTATPAGGTAQTSQITVNVN